MMINVSIKRMLLSLIFLNSIAFSNNVLITQGKVSLTFDDLDGFSYTIPKEDRSGFFNSPVRIDQTLNSILTMKHIVKYAESKNILDVDLINKDVSTYLLDSNEIIKSYNLNDIEFLKLKKFLFNKLAYKYMHVYIKDTVTDNDVLALAKEQYLIDKNSYYQNEELRTLQYITVKFKEDTKDKNKELISKILDEYKHEKFDQLQNNYKENEAVVFTTGIKDFYQTKKYQMFSDFVFKPDSVGVIDGVLETENNYIIVEIINITPIGLKPFEDVKQSLITNLKKQKIKLKFGNLVLQLTQDEILVEEDAIISLKTRYIPKKN